MRVLMLSWEYPPLVVGGIAAHVDGLARAMTRAGHEVVVFSLHHPAVEDDHTVEGVRVLRANIDLPWLPDDNLVARMASANHQITQLAARLGTWRPQVIHAHDWLVAWSADTLKTLWDVPLVATIHATERGRHGGIVPSGIPAEVNAIEWWLTYQAKEVIACSRFMVNEV
ncbi:MAG: putative alpha,4-glucosyltransferase, partial [Ilumatobacteraceae bacterium]|nr:putative alpha,4-glucosyltransferase [Ilumatobacteraceae bacterium]